MKLKVNKIKLFRTIGEYCDWMSKNNNGDIIKILSLVECHEGFLLTYVHHMISTKYRIEQNGIKITDESSLQEGVHF